LGGFIRTQALVSLVDAVLIGTGLLILGMQSQSMKLHAVIVLLAVTLGASAFGVIGRNPAIIDLTGRGTSPGWTL
jgi:putative heme transporter